MAMAENKTQPTQVDPREYVAAIEHPVRRRDAEYLLDLMARLTGHLPVMWGPSIIGFGAYEYRYASGRSGRAPAVGFAAQKASLSLYLLTDAPEEPSLLARLGKHRTGAACLYVNKLDDVNRDLLADLIGASYRHTMEHIHRG